MTTTTSNRWFTFSLPGTDGKPVRTLRAQRADGETVRIAMDNGVRWVFVLVRRAAVLAAGAAVLTADADPALARAADLAKMATDAKSAIRSATRDERWQYERAQVWHARCVADVESVFGAGSVVR